MTLSVHVKRPLTQREQTLDKMLQHYCEAQETLYSGQGFDNAATGCPLMPPVWTASYRELESTLKRMRSESSQDTRRLYWHLGEWYLRCSRRQVERRRTVRHGKKVSVIVDGYAIQTQRHANVNPAAVLQAVEWVSGSFRGEPSVPDEIRKEQGSMDAIAS